jgi:hypothetical protein
MRVGIFGSQDWNDYPGLMRCMTIFLQEAKELGHDKITFVHRGRKDVENMVTEYVGKVEKMLRHNNFKLKEELFRLDGPINPDVQVMESGLDYAIVFSTKDNQSNKYKNLLEAYSIPFALYE